jgi:hypothetical protein
VIVSADDPKRSEQVPSESTNAVVAGRLVPDLSGGAALLAVERLLKPDELQSVTRTGRLTPDHSDADSPASAHVPAALNASSRNYFELRREFTASPDVL